MKKSNIEQAEKDFLLERLDSKTPKGTIIAEYLVNIGDKLEE
jgi:hypothetical protein